MGEVEKNFPCVVNATSVLKRLKRVEEFNYLPGKVRGKEISSYDCFRFCVFKSVLFKTLLSH
jgi:hypothetical protein